MWSNVQVYVMLCFYCFAVKENVSKFWSEGMDKVHSYRCSTAETLYDKDGVKTLTKLTVSDMQVEAFQNTTEVKFTNDGL